MLEISTTVESGRATVFLKGRLNTNTSVQLEQELSSVLTRAKDLTLDFADLEYISSAGLRVIVWAFKSATAAEGSLDIVHSNDDVKEVFEITGLSDVIDVG